MEIRWIYKFTAGTRVELGLASNIFDDTYTWFGLASNSDQSNPATS